MHTDYRENLIEAQNLLGKVKPLTAIFLLMEYSYEEVLTDIKKIDSIKIMNRLNVRIHQAYQLLEYQRQDIGRKESQLPTDAFEKSYCDFKTVMEILDFSRGKIETLIRKGTIIAIQDKLGEKRRFDKEKILEYRAGLKK